MTVTDEAGAPVEADSVELFDEVTGVFIEDCRPNGPSYQCFRGARRSLLVVIKVGDITIERTGYSSRTEDDCYPITLEFDVIIE